MSTYGNVCLAYSVSSANRCFQLPFKALVSSKLHLALTHHCSSSAGDRQLIRNGFGKPINVSWLHKHFIISTVHFIKEELRLANILTFSITLYRSFLGYIIILLRSCLCKPQTFYWITILFNPWLCLILYERIQSCENLLGFWPRLFIFIFYQLQFLKSILFMILDTNLRDTIIKNMTKKLYIGSPSIDI